jgi:hypothetical protein
VRTIHLRSAAKYSDEGLNMKIGLLSIGLLLVFLGIAISGIAKSSVTITGNDLQKIAEGIKDIPEVSNVNLTKGDIFVAKYYGGGSNVDPNEAIVNVYDPYGNLTSGISYLVQFQKGTLANYTGPYRIQVGAPGLIDPATPLQIVVFKMIISNRIEYPNSSSLPFGIASVFAGAGVCILGISSGRKTPKRFKKTAR